MTAGPLHRSNARILLVWIWVSLASSASGQAPAGNSLVNVRMQNVLYHFNDSIAVHIRRLSGHLAPARGPMPVFDDKQSFVIQIASAEIAISADSLANVLNSYVFAAHDAPLKSIAIRTGAQGYLTVKGKLHSKGDIPFEAEGVLSTTDDGKIRLHTEKIKALHLPVKGLLELLGVDLSRLVETGKVSGVKAEKNDLILDPQKLLPPPHIAGQVTAIRVEQNNIVQIFGHAGADSIPKRTGNYMAYRGNQLRFGKLTMSDTDLTLIDMDPADPFDFYLDHYVEQLVAGYTKETPSFGLHVYVRDYNKLKNRGSAHAR